MANPETPAEIPNGSTNKLHELDSYAGARDMSVYNRPDSSRVTDMIHSREKLTKELESVSDATNGVMRLSESAWNNFCSIAETNQDDVVMSQLLNFLLVNSPTLANHIGAFRGKSGGWKMYAGLQKLGEQANQYALSVSLPDMQNINTAGSGLTIFILGPGAPNVSIKKEALGEKVMRRLQANMENSLSKLDEKAFKEFSEKNDDDKRAYFMKNNPQEGIFIAFEKEGTQQMMIVTHPTQAGDSESFTIDISPPLAADALKTPDDIDHFVQQIIGKIEQNGLQEKYVASLHVLKNKGNITYGTAKITNGYTTQIKIMHGNSYTFWHQSIPENHPLSQ